MTLRLILIRHAKSSWDDLGQDDHARPLNSRGRSAAPLIGGWLKDHGYSADLVLCSDATRTRETLARLLPEWGISPRITFLRDLYLAPATAMLAELQKSDAATVAMIGHNPGIGSFACGLLHERPDHPKYAAYPTCATAIIDFDAASWSEINAATGRLTAFITPRDLSDEQEAD